MKKIFITLNVATLLAGCSTTSIPLNSRTVANVISEHDGIKFKCAPDELKSIEENVVNYFNSLGIKEEWYGHQIIGNHLSFTLKTPTSDKLPIVRKTA